MSELRQDPATREWVIIADQRARRPHEYRQPERLRDEAAGSGEDCPFCPGNESKTPEALLTLPGEGPWRVRVVSNLYPALTPDGDTARRTVDEHYIAMDGVGAHEVVIETPDHDRQLPLRSDEEVFELLSVYQQRYLALREDRRIKLIIIFKNYGLRAGTSLEHPHSQIVATPIEPAEVRRKYEIATDYYEDHGRCLYCDMVEWELAAGRRVVMETEGFVVLHPYASRSPFETVIMPRRHQTSFASVEEGALRELARVLRVTLVKIRGALGDPDYNYILHSPPVEDEQEEYYLWHIRIVPRLTTIAGFEMGSGMYINTALPEETARFIREFALDG